MVGITFKKLMTVKTKNLFEVHSISTDKTFWMIVENKDLKAFDSGNGKWGESIFTKDEAINKMK